MRALKNPNFNPSARTGWDQCHCKYYQIRFLTTIHESKSELKQLRYLENHAKRISTFPEAITFYSTIGFSISIVFWKPDIQSFLGTPRSTQLESRKAFKCVIKFRTEKREKTKLLMSARLTQCTYSGRQANLPHIV